MLNGVVHLYMEHSIYINMWSGPYLYM